MAGKKKSKSEVKKTKKVKFREITLLSGARFLLGKDEESNDRLMRLFKGKASTILHTQAPGSPFCVVEKQVFEGDIYAAATACARYSQDWRDNKKDIKVNVFTGKDISKPKGAKPGLWHVGNSRTIIVKKKDILKLING